MDICDCKVSLNVLLSSNCEPFSNSLGSVAVVMGITLGALARGRFLRQQSQDMCFPMRSDASDITRVNKERYAMTQ